MGVSDGWMQELDPDKPLGHAMHVDVSVAREHREPIRIGEARPSRRS